MEQCRCINVSPSESPIFKKKVEPSWEEYFGLLLAVILAALEGKRFFLLTLELIAELQIVKFCGGTTPLVFSFLDIFLGFPGALLASYAIRK